MNDDAPVAARPRRRWLQFRLRTLLAITLIASLPLWAFNARLQKVRRQRRAATAVNAAGGDVWFAVEQKSAKPAPPPAAVVFYSNKTGRFVRGSSIAFDSQDSISKGSPLSRLVDEARSGDAVAVDFSPRHGSPGLAGRNPDDAIAPDWVLHAAEYRSGENAPLPWDELNDLTDLQVLSFSDTRVGDDEMRRVRQFANLRCLIARDASQVTDTGLASIGRLKRLRVLSLGGAPITDDGLKYLSMLTRLEVLELDHAPIHGPGLAHLSSLCNLRLLSLRFSPLEDEGLAYLGGLTSLERLYFFNTRVTDTGLKYLRPLTGLQILHLGKTRVTFEGANAFERDLPCSPIIR